MAQADGAPLQSGVLDTHSLPARVYWGASTKDVLPRALERLGCRRAVLLVSRSLRRGSREVDDIAAALGGACAAVWEGMPAHTPREAVLEAAEAARRCGADVVVTIGGGSLTDGGKVARIALATGAASPAALGEHVWRPGARPSRARLLPQVAVPTTLSAGEFAPGAGCTDAATGTKDAYVFADALPRAVILDPGLAARTPERLFLGTGLRAVDHCVEALCSPSGNEYSDGLAAAGLALLARGLREVRAAPGDPRPRSRCQLGMLQAAQASLSGPRMGASHAIGHILGPLCGVPHGETSCVVLPAVLRWNAAAGGPDAARQRQRLVVRAFADAGRAPDADRAAEAASDAAECVAGLVADLGLPRCLADVGVPAARLEDCARRTMHDPLVRSNPRRIEAWTDVLEILRSCGPCAPPRGETSKL